ncbi:hypothetical protein SEA_LOSER_64 [Mycobacterium phage Loser]|nr:hypothetical protein SEA_LOSER_64 [Mycobacterium phage Loser]AMS00960.1 hypothetical protein SEA_LOSER_64 [Mycobacterium phage Loser]
MNPVLFALDLHIVALGLLAYFCLVMDARSRREAERDAAEEATETVR